MTTYDFLILSPSEFEYFSRDLLQKKLNVFIESFTSGKDGGIDLRYASDKNKTIIIQSKRVNNFSNLISQLKKEQEKVKALKPARYVITTTVGLTPHNKDQILKLFSPHISAPEDILGKEDLNNLLSQYSEIEHKYFKLWISSTNILEKFLHSKIYNQSQFEISEIKEHVRLYVQNESFNEALKILSQNKYVIISGIPGIGKTTLSRILVLFLLSQGYEEFIYLSDSIDDGYTFFLDDKKQIFFFDDFLGQNFFDRKQVPNEDNKIVKFIQAIKKANNKVLILATREYILNQAKSAYEAFHIHNIEIAKCTLDLSSYTNLIKAQIIHNHLFFAGVPNRHLLNLVKNKNYIQLVNHKNYNPRIIETIINRKIWEHCKPGDFTKVFKSFFDNPQSVWTHAFENSLDKYAQNVLFVLLTTGSPALLGDLESAIKEFYKVNNFKYYITHDSIKFNRSLRELENTFIKTIKDSESGIVVDFQNPSIRDFLINYLIGKNDIISNILSSAIFTEQFFTAFTGKIETNEYARFKILLDKEQIETAVSRISHIFSKLKSSYVFRLTEDGNDEFRWWRSNNFIYTFLKRIYDEYSFSNSIAKDLVYEKFQGLVYMNTYPPDEQRSYVYLLSNLDLTKLEFNEENLIDSFLVNISFLDGVEIFAELKQLFPSTFRELLTDQKLFNKVETLIHNEIERVKDSEIHSVKSQIETIGNTLDFDYSETIFSLEAREQAYEDALDAQLENKMHDFESKFEDKVDNEEEAIDEIFRSLVGD